MANFEKCSWCGRKFEKKGINKFISNNTFGLAGKENLCSAKCKKEFEQASLSSQGTENKSSNNSTNIPPIQPEDAWGNTIETISHRLNSINTKAKIEAKDKDKKAEIIEEMEFGIMRLRSLEAKTEADFFEKKLEDIKKIKKKWYE